jgi:hypothetical protein
MDELTKILSQFGFPVAVATFLLVRVEKRMETLEKSINELSEKIEILITTCGRRKK